MMFGIAFFNFNFNNYNTNLKYVAKDSVVIPNYEGKWSEVEKKKQKQDKPELPFLFQYTLDLVETWEKFTQ